MNLTYEKNGDYLIPTLQADIQPEGTVTKYGMMRETYLKENHRGVYSAFLLKGTLKEHLLTIQKQAEERKPFVLPEPAGDNSYLISYLNQERGISRTVIDLFLKDGLIYESRHYHNVVFKGNDKNGVTRFASMRGVFDKQGKPFKCDVTGNDKNYGFNVVNVNSTELVVFEAAIDLMSYVDIFTDYESNKLALGMLADAPLETFLREHPQITSIRFCLDGDEPGRKAAAELMRKYYELGYEVEDCPPPAGYKDYNEWLVAAKLNLNRMNQRADEPVRA